MFKIESYVTPILLSYVDKYVKDFKPADAQVSLWGGGVVLHNLVLKADVLQQEVSLPFTLISGRIHELLIQVPWTKIMSEPIVVTIDTIECVLNLRKPTPASEAQAPQPSRRTQVVEAPPGYMQALVRRIVSNIVLRVHHLIVKYVEDDIVLSLNVKYLIINCADGNWKPAFADIDQAAPVLRRLVQLEDFTLCLDRADSDGKIRFYQEPLLYRCQLNLRVMTRLISANTRRASALYLDIRSSKLAWGVSSDQLALLLRLLRDRANTAHDRASAASPAAATAQQTAATNTEASTAEPAAAADSWSEWAWSWLPTLKDQDDELPEAMLPAVPIPVHFQLYLDSVVVVYKIMELEGTKKRARGVLELHADYTALTGLIRTPTLMQTSLGIRSIKLLSHGKCVCGHLDMQTSAGEPTFYLTKSAPVDDKEWDWPEVEIEQETFSPVADSYRQPFVGQTQVPGRQIGTLSDSVETTETTAEATTEAPEVNPEPAISENAFWKKLEPVVLFQITHERAPPMWSTFNPYENPPTDFEYSDWNETLKLSVNVHPIECMLCMGLMHRFAAISVVFRDLPPPPASELTYRTLTVEECESLLDNLPQRRVDIVCERIVLRLLPWDHSLTEKPMQPPIALHIDLPNTTLLVTGPLYPRRVCEAVCQFPNETGPLCEGARLSIIATVESAQLKLAPFGDDSPGNSRPVARTDIKFIYRHLLHPYLFHKRQRSILSSFKMQIGELNVCGSLARLLAAWQVVESLIKKKRSSLLKYSSLPIDATSDEENVAVDMTVEDIHVKQFVSAIVTTHIVTVQAMRVTALHASGPSKDQPKQAWLFSGPDNPVSTPYLRLAVQLNAPGERSNLEFVGLWTEPTAAAMDPLLLAFLAYKPEPRTPPDQPLVAAPRSITSSAFLRIRNTPPSSSGRGASRSSSGAELVHTVRARSKDSSSEPERLPKPQAAPKPKPWSADESLLWLHQRLSRLTVSVDLGLVLVYVPLRSASAVDCVTVRDAMERHASSPRQNVLCVSLGRLNVRCVSMLRNLWKDIRLDGPTFGRPTLSPEEDSFPWKMMASDMSCYTISARAAADTTDLGHLKSHVKMGPVTPQTVLELVTTAVTLSVVTKKMAVHAHRDQPKPKEPATDKTKFFQTGLDFKPTTLKEFIRGPASRKSQSNPDKDKSKAADAKNLTGPVVSLGVNIHADTPPLIVRLDHEQVTMVATAVHSLMHLLKLVKHRPVLAPRSATASSSEQFRTMRSVSESEEPHGSSETSHASETSELIPIFESSQASGALKKFFWFQWVVCRGTVVVTSEEVKLAFDIDDIISTVDLQDQYHQFKVKVTSASVKHYEKQGLDWVAGVLGGRILEAREPTSAREDNNFMGVTITQARIVDLPVSWKEELHPKLLESKKGLEKDTIWEIYATLAPLEAVLQPLILENIILLLQEVAPQTLCNIQSETTESYKGVTKWPYLYLVAGGLRLLVSSDEGEGTKDDTFIVQVGKVEVNPHPENPICRRRVSASPDSWASVGTGHEGRQYEMFVRDIAVLSTKFKQIVCQETSETNLGTTNTNPALKWTQPLVPPPKLTPILHNMDINCVIAPTFYLGASLACGPGLELNLTTDVSLELNLDQLVLSQCLANQLRSAVRAGMQYYLSHFDPDEPDEVGVCPYAVLIDDFKQEFATVVDEADPSNSETDSEPETKASSHAADSGVEASVSCSMPKKKEERKAANVAFVDATSRASEHAEIFVTMGIIELSLYVIDDGSPAVAALRPPGEVTPPLSAARVAEESQSQTKESKEAKDSTMPARFDEEPPSGAPSCSDKSNDVLREPHIGKANTELRSVVAYARRIEGMLPLMHVTLQQPNMYYWKKKTQKNVQLSLFNMWVGLGEGELEDLWHLSLVSTARGSPDPVTDIPPALATCRLLLPCGTGGMSSIALGSRGTISLDVERPVLLEVSEDRLVRLKGVIDLVRSRLSNAEERKPRNDIVEAPNNILYDLRRHFVSHALESVTVQTGQVGLAGSLGACGWESLSLQVAAGARPERLVARALLGALLVSLGPPGDQRHLLVHPCVLGGEMQATWESWRRVEGLFPSQEPIVQLRLDLDRLLVDVKPEDLFTLKRLLKVLENIRSPKPDPRRPSAMVGGRSTFTAQRSSMPARASFVDRGPPLPKTPSTTERRMSMTNEPAEPAEHYYKDDLRSGAFKMVSGGQLPMVYQVTMFEGTVSWKYPHPRAITRIVAFPLPDQNEEVRCVLEHYIHILGRWDAHAHIDLPTGEPREYRLHSPPPDAQFASMWRIRICAKNEETPPFEFHTVRFLPRADPLVTEQRPDEVRKCNTSGVTAEQLAGSLRVDSYFSPKHMPRLRAVANLAMFELHFHNSLPFVSSQVKELEGYYVSRPLMKAHRVLGCLARDSAVHLQVSPVAGLRALLHTTLSSQVMECATGTIEPFIEEARCQAALSVPECERDRARVRFRAAPIRALMHVPRMRTFKALADDWRAAVELCEFASSTSLSTGNEATASSRQLEEVTALELEGRVSLWIRNYCTLALRVGQEGTDQLLPIGPGARLAYRWRNPAGPKRLRFARVTPSTEWSWSKSIPFTAGTSRVRLEHCDDLRCTEGEAPGSGLFLHTRVTWSGARRTLRLSGRLALANMLRYHLLFKVRGRCPPHSWRTVNAGELLPESFGHSVLVSAECDVVLKIKFVNHDTGWSGDIPLKECPKENVPWLVKVPSDGELPYVAVWCRVVRGRTDGCIMATIWPLYVLYSHLPLDIDVLITTEPSQTPTESSTECRLPTLVQTALGRGQSTHLMAPGTTAARHSLTFQYRNIESPVTREAVPLHYGVTSQSVFEQRAPIQSITVVIDEIEAWLERSGSNCKSTWPYSTVTSHWPGIWKPALLQPRCDVTARYRAISAGGGCCLEVQLCPLLLLANASCAALTLRAHDAAPLCKLEPGYALSPPSALLQKTFFLSLELGRETYVSPELGVWHGEAGQYGAPPPRRVAPSHPAPIAILCGTKLALFMLYYEVKDEIHCLGISNTYIVINKLDTELMVSAVALAGDCEERLENDVLVKFKSFIIVEPTREGSIHGTALSRFALQGQWDGEDASKLRTFLGLALPDGSKASAGAVPTSSAAPVALSAAPVRRALSLRDSAGHSVAVVATLQRHDHRWLITVAADPCPQLLVHNLTRRALAVAQPRDTSVPYTCVPECPGARWQCVVQPNSSAHYSTPAHCARYPPATPPPARAPTFITLGTAPDPKEAKALGYSEEPPLEWCAPVAVAAGEQLVQLAGGATVKARVLPHPHSTLLELRDVDQNDISASDIRRRLAEGAPDRLRFSLHDGSRLSTIRNSVDMTAQEEEEEEEDKELGDDDVISLGSAEAIAEDAISAADANSAAEGSTQPAPELSVAELKRIEEQFTVLKRPSLRDSDSSAAILRARGVSGNEASNPEQAASTDGGEQDRPAQSAVTLVSASDVVSPDASQLFSTMRGSNAEGEERVRGIFDGLVIELSAASDTGPLLAIHADRAAVLLVADSKGMKATISIAEVQVDNRQYDSGQYDFAVVSSTCNAPPPPAPWAPLWSICVEDAAFDTREGHAHLLLSTRHDRWTVGGETFNELTELDVRLGPLALYVEDAYVSALVRLFRDAFPPREPTAEEQVLAECLALQRPLRLRSLLIQPLHLTLTLHTAVRMYIALDQSPLTLSAFLLHDMMTSAERLTHALTVHYLSAAILGAGWVVGGLELLGAPGALAARVGGASGGVRGVASAAAAALLRSLSAWAGSLARNLDLLAGDEEHARRAAAARRRPPTTFFDGLGTGITNFAINLLGAVGGLAHHPLVGVAVGETDSGAAALRRGLLGAVAKPLSATADLLAYAGHGLLHQTGWDPVPQPRAVEPAELAGPGWRRDCVRWCFRLAELSALDGFEVLVDSAPLQLLLTHKYMVVADPETERIVEMIDFKFCSLGPYQGPVIELIVAPNPKSKSRTAVNADEEIESQQQLNATAMARVARYTGAAAVGPGAAGAGRSLALLPAPGLSHALHAALAALLHHNHPMHLTLI